MLQALQGEELVVRQLNDTTIDVFTGSGWTAWSRFEVVHNHGKLLLKLVKGVPMSKDNFHKLYERLSK